MFPVFPAGRAAGNKGFPAPAVEAGAALDLPEKAPGPSPSSCKKFFPMERNIGISCFMEKRRLPRILIATAGYGEGHNSAARGVRDALAGRAEVRVTDLCAEAMPRMFRVTRAAYLWIISRLPRLWKLMYEVSDRRNLAEKPVKGLAPVERLLERLLREWKPDAVVCTYMVYPYMLDSLASRTEHAVPYLTVVTDSCVINKSWLCSESPLWAVTDRWTRDIMVEKGLPPDRLRVTGFPVHPGLGALAREHPASWKDGEPFRVLYFAQRSARHARRELEAMLEADPSIRVTCILGRRFRRIYPRIRDLRARYGRRLDVRGWTCRVPSYLAATHVVVGKAGGATVHEVLAAARPMLVNFLLPGQEEGNARLLEKLGGGCHVPDARALAAALQGMMADGGAGWRHMHEHLLQAEMTGGSAKIADLVLKLAEERTN